MVLISKTGVLVTAHGSRDPKWIELIDQAVQQARIDLPVRVGFLELVNNRSLSDGVRYFEQKGMRNIIVLPLFITEGSTHLNEIRYALGLISEPVLETDIEPIPHKAKISWCPPLEDHIIVQEILVERVKELIQNPAEELLFLIGHGSEETGFHERWEHLLQQLAICLKKRFGFKGASYATLHPDTILKRASALSRKNKLIVLPVFLSEGYFTNFVIPHRLKNLSYLYNGKAFLPHPLLSAWMEESVRQSVLQIKSKQDHTW